MFVLITILFYDLGYYEPENRKTTFKETTTSSSTPEEEKVEAIEVP
jgi:hypothetical protein